MAAQSNDIKQLFSHLGLDPRDYREIRPRPPSNATVAHDSVVVPPELLMPPVPRAPPMPLAPAAAPTAPAPVRQPATAPVADVEARFEPTPSPANLPPAATAAPRREERREDLGSPITISVPTPTTSPETAENLHSLFQQVKEPVSAGTPAEDEEPVVEGSLREVMAEAHGTYGSAPALPSDARTGPVEESRATAALDAALARLKDATARLQSPLGITQTRVQPGAGSSLQDVFRRISSRRQH